MQDDYNRFIRRSMKQARCNYEDIFAAYDDAGNAFDGCMGTMSDMNGKNSCGCGNVMSDTESHMDCGCGHNCKPVCDIPVMVFIEMQPFGKMYNEAEGLCRGTLFPALDKPFTGRGGNCR